MRRLPRQQRPSPSLQINLLVAKLEVSSTGCEPLDNSPEACHIFTFGLANLLLRRQEPIPDG